MNKSNTVPLPIYGLVGVTAEPDTIVSGSLEVIIDPSYKSYIAPGGLTNNLQPMRIVDQCNISRRCRRYGFTDAIGVISYESNPRPYSNACDAYQRKGVPVQIPLCDVDVPRTDVVWKKGYAQPPTCSSHVMTVCGFSSLLAVGKPFSLLGDWRDPYITVVSLTGGESLLQQLFVALSECVELGDTVRSGVQFLIWIRNLTKGRIKKLPTLRDAAKAYLAMKFGFEPLADDVKTLIDATFQFVNGGFQSLLSSLITQTNACTRNNEKRILRLKSELDRLRILAATRDARNAELRNKSAAERRRIQRERERLRQRIAELEAARERELVLMDDRRSDILAAYDLSVDTSWQQLTLDVTTLEQIISDSEYQLIQNDLEISRLQNEVREARRNSDTLEGLQKLLNVQSALTSARAESTRLVDQLSAAYTRVREINLEHQGLVEAADDLRFSRLHAVELDKRALLQRYSQELSALYSELNQTYRVTRKSRSPHRKTSSLEKRIAKLQRQLDAAVREPWVLTSRAVVKPFPGDKPETHANDIEYTCSRTLYWNKGKPLRWEGAPHHEQLLAFLKECPDIYDTIHVGVVDDLVYGIIRVNDLLGMDSLQAMIAHTMGLLSPVGTVWELLPLSFVIDWFVNASSLIRRLEKLAAGLASDAQYYFIDGIWRSTKLGCRIIPGLPTQIDTRYSWEQVADEGTSWAYKLTMTFTLRGVGTAPPIAVSGADLYTRKPLKLTARDWVTMMVPAKRASFTVGKVASGIALWLGLSHNK